MKSYNNKAKILNDKLSYILKIINLYNFKINDDNIEIVYKTDDLNYCFNIYYENDNKPLFILIQNNNILLQKHILDNFEEININIENYEKIEDIIFKIYKIIKNNKDLLPNNNNIFLKDLEEKKIDFLNNNYKLNIGIFSLRSILEMITDQIIKINKIFDIELISLFEIKIVLNKFSFDINNELKITILLNLDTDLINIPPTINIKSNIPLKNNLLNIIEKLSPFNDKSLWSIKYSIYEIINKIYEIINLYGEINLMNNEQSLLDLEYLFGLSKSNISINQILLIFDKDLIVEKSLSKKEYSNYWKKGTGYGNNLTSEWNIEEYINITIEKRNEINNKFKILIEEILNNNNIFEIFYLRISEIFKSYLNCDDIIDSNIISILNILNINFNLINNIEKYVILYQDIYEYIKDNELDIKINNYQNIDKIININIDEYQKIFYDYKFYNYSNIFNEFSYLKNINISSLQLNTLKKEFNILKKSIINTKDASIFFCVQQSDISRMKFIISGTKNTPYEYGLLLFDITINNDYPISPPLVEFINHGNKRFNPNIYDTGKVCLSLLGTWKGDKGESWNSLTSTFFQIIISIQSQILIEEPYFNEPGYEKYISKQYGICESKNYNNNIKQYVLDHAINDLLESVINKKRYIEFEYIIINYFKYHKDDIIINMNKWLEEIIENKIKFQTSINKFIYLISSL